MARKKFCDWCLEEDEVYMEDDSKLHYMSITRQPFARRIMFYSAANLDEENYNELAMEIEYNYCPVCGAKIYDEMRG